MTETDMKKDRIIAAAMLTFLPFCTEARQVMTLQECRDSAAANNRSLKMAGQEIVIAEYGKKAARANYFPDISINAGYMYNARDIDLIGQERSEKLTNAGNALQGALAEGIGNLLADPETGSIIMNSPEMMKLLGKLSETDVAGPANAIGAELNDALHLDISNMFLGTVSLRQPVFMGGKIVAADKAAALAGDLAGSRYETEYRAVISEVDRVYWQTVSLSGKLQLAREYNELLRQLLDDAEKMAAAGIATEADVLAVKVKANEAAMMLTKAENGVSLSRMLLCRICGMDLNTDIELADEGLDRLQIPQAVPEMSNEEIFSSRPEIRSLELAAEIYDRKTAIARADMMPHVALTANYILSNPNLYNGFRNDFGGTFNVGVAVSIPIIHGCSARQKVNKAKAEAVLTRYRIEEAKETISLQVARLRMQHDEALKKLAMAGSNLDSAEENLRTARIGFTEGTVPANTVMQAQTAWMQAHSEYIDAGIELQMCASDLAIAEGRAPVTGTAAHE